MTDKPEFNSYAYWHPLRQAHKGAIQGPALKPLKLVSDEHPNGIASVRVSDGMAQLLVMDDFRAQCLNSGFQPLIDLGNAWPQVWSFDGTLEDTAIAATLSDEVKFNVAANCSSASMFTGAYSQYQPTFWRAPNGYGGFTTGTPILDAGSLSIHATLNDLPAICAAAWKRSQLQL